MQKAIQPCIWFNKDAEDAARFYSGVFNNFSMGKASRYGKEGFEAHHMPEGTVMTVEVSIEGYKMLFLNGGPVFKKNPSVSFFIVCSNAAEAKAYWGQLIEGGEEMMAFDKYSFSEAYGWVQDRFGINWQIYTGEMENKSRKIIPALMFTGPNAGKAEEAMGYYTKVFKDASIQSLHRYPPGTRGLEGSIMHAEFHIGENAFVAFDSHMKHDFNFNEGVSLVIYCDNQKEIDYFWNEFTNEGKESMCGWLKDKYGLSWQITPTVLPELISDPVKGKGVMNAMLKMRKLDIRKLEEA